MRTRFLAVLSTGLFIAFAAGCGPVAGRGGPPSPVRVSVLPDQAESNLRAAYEPLLARLAASTGLHFELTIPPSYESQVDAFAKGEVDLAWFGGLTFVQAWERAGAEALVMRDVDLGFTSVFVVPGDAPAAGLEDLRGARFAFGPAQSTSGHLMPRAFLGDRGIVPTEFFASIEHTPGHDQTALRVRDDAAAAGAMNARILRAMLEDGRLAPGDLRVLAEAPPYNNYVWAARGDMDPRVRAQITDAFLALDRTDPADAAILAGVGASFFLPAGPKDFGPLRSVALSLGMLAGAP